ncbi:MAG: methylated-DNA--[protein]-cysteine S-methyltransferase [Chloroflexi bacterium]|nr:methylated-DNA--[protein]-cysteine S-methyltransferase [Chloroflexota bacterium]
MSSAQGVMRVCSMPSPFGELALIWQAGSRPRLHYICLPEESFPVRFGSLQKGSCTEIEGLAEAVQRVLAGEAAMFDWMLLALEQCSPFQQRVLLAEYEVPRGQVTTYGLLARHLGCPQAGRAVGQALGRNPFPLLIPCHRAVRADGHLGGYRGGLAMKRYLLEAEGVAISPEGKVLVERFCYAI